MSAVLFWGFDEIVDPEDEEAHESLLIRRDFQFVVWLNEMVSQWWSAAGEAESLFFELWRNVL